MIPSIVTLAQAGAHRGAMSSTPIIPPVAQAETATIPAARQVSAAGAYFGLFKLCSCGHSSAWHSGAFGDAWRAGEQVQGRCESSDEVSSGSCGCGSFQAA
ncbi:hypothetical protein acdb102_07350 [Acidothermaceae bacterium B102]|nr:hypothetical protein acdb102_07350 [Acidothermaceae bacterium B102]